MPVIDYKEALSNPNAIDHANVEIQGMSVSRTVKLGLFTTNENAVKAADRILSRESYPYAKVRLAANRKAFRLQPGDPFVLKYPKYGITQMICRVLYIEEESVESDKIIIHAIEEEVNAVKPVELYEEPENTRVQPVTYQTLGLLDKIYVSETTYAITPNEYAVNFFVPKKTGNESGFIVWMSQDGEEYYRLATRHFFTPYGTLTQSYGITSSIDEDVGIHVQFNSAQNTTLLQSIADIELYGTRNISILQGAQPSGLGLIEQEEIISFRTVTVESTNVYHMTGVLRGALDTQMKEHAYGTGFYFADSMLEPVRSSVFTLGKTVYFKVVPFSETGTGDIADAEVITYTFDGRAFAPYVPINLRANDQAVNPRYNPPENITLTWDARAQDSGAGTGNPSIIIDSTPTWDGYFRVKVYVGGSLVRTAEGINDLSWTYTSVMNIDDNEDYPNRVGFKVTSYIPISTGGEYESEESANIEVRRETLSTTTTTTTSTTSTTTTTTSSTTTTT